MLEQYIMMAEQALEKEFKVRPYRSKLVIHKDWASFIVQSRLCAKSEGVFLPKDLTAHIPKKSLEEMLPLVYHELEGHGTYCEHSSYGKRLVQDEKVFQALESDVKASFALECQARFNAIRPYFEGFAVWMEEFLLSDLGRHDIWEARADKLTRMPLNQHHSYFDAYRLLKKFESEKGRYELWRALGFEELNRRNEA